MANGKRTVSAQTIRMMADYSGLDIPDDQVEAVLALLQVQVDYLNLVDNNERLGFQLNHRIQYVPASHRFAQVQQPNAMP